MRFFEISGVFITKDRTDFLNFSNLVIFLNLRLIFLFIWVFSCRFIDFKKVEDAFISCHSFLTSLWDFLSIKKHKYKVLNVEKVHFFKVVHHSTNIGLITPNEDDSVMDEFLRKTQLILIISDNIPIVPLRSCPSQCLLKHPERSMSTLTDLLSQ